MIYRTSAPLYAFYPDRELDLERALHELRRTRSERVFLIAPDIFNQESLSARMPRLSACLDFFAKAGLETGAWIGQTIGHGGGFGKVDARFAPIVNLQGNPENAICPLNEAFKRVVCDGVCEIARAGARTILIDDDFRLGERSGSVGCFCERHLEAFRARTGLQATREEVAEKAFTGPPSRFRDDWLEVTGDSLAQLAREMRAAVDSVDPAIRLGLCACTSTWDIDGISSDELSRIMAGKTRPLLRLIGAPYWAGHGQRLAPIIELARLQRSWIPGNIEVIAEGDTWPRPRHHTPAAWLEGFDTALRADGRMEGILKYMFDYVSSFDYETKYADLAERNQPLYADIERIFSGRVSVGVNVVRKMKTLRAADLPTPANTGFLYANFFQSSAIRFLTDNAIPIAYGDVNGPAIVFGLDAKGVDRKLLRNGVILDAVAARLLCEQGIDVGLQQVVKAGEVSREVFSAESETVQTQGSRYAMTLDARAQILSTLATANGEIPGAYLYENAAGERFLVYAFDACESQNDRGAFRSYCRQRQLIDAIAWLAHRPLDAVCPRHPDLYILVKKDEDGLAIGLWNFFADAVESPQLFLADDYTDAEIINCGDVGYTMADKQLTLHGNIAPHGFAGILLRRCPAATSEGVSMHVHHRGAGRAPAESLAPLWRVTELRLESDAPYQNPFADAEVTVSFHGPGNATVQRPAFWDGDNIWKVRFAPTVPGTWRWTSVCSNTDDAGLHNRRGELTAAAVATDLPLYQHGFLRVSKNGRHFVYADGTPFFWLGDTHWQMPDHERVDACNHPEHAGGACPHGGQFQHLLADRLARGFNVYQTYPHAASAHWWTAPFTRINPTRFREVFDVQMDRLADAGLVIALGCGHFNNSTQIPAADLCRWARYLVARYGAHPVVWITCQEMNAPVGLDGKESNRPGVWKAVAEQIARDDDYRHPHSAHQWVLDVDVAPLGREPWHTWFALQGGHRNSGLTPQARYRGYYDYRPTRPVLETEAMYERVDCGGVNTTEEARQSAWKALLCGSPGYTYGGAGIWFIKWDAADPGCAQYNHAIGSWHAGMELPGAAQMTVLKQFFTSFDWPALTPRFNDPAWAAWADPERCVLATIGTRVYLAYCYGDSSQGKLKGLDRQANYTASWFDPRTGEETPIAARVRAGSHGSWPVPAKPAGDWVLRVTRNKEQ